jgi:hypothetical protein
MFKAINTIRKCNFKRRYIFNINVGIGANSLPARSNSTKIMQILKALAPVPEPFLQL